MSYVYWWIQFTNAGQRVECALCNGAEDLSGPAGTATVESEAFIKCHRTCGSDAA